MNRNTLTNFHGQLGSLKTSSIPQVKHFLRKRIAKCINECKMHTINMKKSIGYSSSKGPHNELEYEFDWESDFDDLDDEDDEKAENIQVTEEDNFGKNRYRYDTIHTSSLPKFNSLVKRPSTNPPAPPLPKCPPPVETHFNLFKAPKESMSTIIDMNKQPDSDYLVPNMTYSKEVIDRPLPPIPLNENDDNGYDELKYYKWFHDIERDEAENLLRQLSENGTFLVRKSRRAGICNPYTLTLFYNNRIFHLNIRKRQDRLFALGTEKPREKTFYSVPDLIEYHSREPIYLTSKGLIAGKTTLIMMSIYC